MPRKTQVPITNIKHRISPLTQGRVNTLGRLKKARKRELALGPYITSQAHRVTLRTNHNFKISPYQNQHKVNKSQVKAGPQTKEGEEEEEKGAKGK